MVELVLADIPDSITAGDAVSWKRTIPGAPASDGWVLSYALIKDGKQIIFAGSADGDNHVVALGSADTVDWPVGLYKFSTFVTKDGNRYQIEEGIVEIGVDPIAATDGADALPPCFKVRDAIQAVLEMRATESQTSLAVGGRQISEMSHTEMMDALNRAKTACNVWQRKNRRQRGKSTGSKIKISFTD
jgi:hypothetical protein